MLAGSYRLFFLICPKRQIALLEVNFSFMSTLINLQIALLEITSRAVYCSPVKSLVARPRDAGRIEEQGGRLQ